MTSRFVKRLCCFSALLFAGLLFPIAGLNADTLVEAGAKTEWKYLDDGTEPAPDWYQTGYEDAKWKSGRAPLGYDDPSLRTIVSFGGNARTKHITTYFRHRFEVPDKGQLRQLIALLRVDDGAVIYLNGKEIARENLAAGATNSKTPATRRIELREEEVYRRFLLPISDLAAGTNTLAVEVHQCDAVSSDIVFDLALKAYSQAQQPRPPRLVPEASGITRLFNEQHYLTGGTIIPDGYLDGGRSSNSGGAGGVREVLVVDRTRDAALQKHLAVARSDTIGMLPPVERGRVLARYVDSACSPREGREFSQVATNLLEAEYRGLEMLLGNSAGAGVCRHRALLFKILADEAGLNVALARGNLHGSSGPHVWNEIILADGKKLIVDCMNPSRDFELPETASPAAKNYLTVKNEPYYP